MTFLDDLLSFDLDRGTNIYVQKQKKSFLQNLFGKKEQGPQYKKHITKAGLPLVLPYNQDGTLCISSKKKNNFHRTRKWPGDFVLWKGFHLTETVEREEDGKVILESVVKKHGYSKELEYSMNVLAKYSVSEEGKIVNLILQSDFISENPEMVRTMWFEIFPHSNEGVAVAKGPLPEGLELPNVPQDCGVDYENTLETFVEFLESWNIGPYEMVPLFHLSYVMPRTLH